jgi:putative DNA primase/helicase
VRNYEDVLGQLLAAGLRPKLPLRIGALTRCPVEEDREKRGWYAIHEVHGQDGQPLLVGSFGTWHGADPHATKIEIKRDALSRDQIDTLRARLKEDRKRADQARKVEADRAAKRAASAWERCSPTGDAPYLRAKGVGAHGIRFSPSGAVVLPLLDTADRIHGLQVIRTAEQARKRGKPDLTKEFWPSGLAKKGHFHLIGMPQSVLLIAEGYATGASLHEATGLPVAIAYDANNIEPVAAALHAKYKRTRILICADDDTGGKCRQCGARVWTADAPTECPSCGQPHGYANAGVTAASTVAVAVSGAWVRPAFPDEPGRRTGYLERGIKVTDFNDLHAAAGLHLVRHQIEGKLSELGWAKAPAAARGTSPPEGAGAAALRPIQSVEEMLERYVLVYAQGGTVFDRQEHILLSLSDMRDACIRRDLHRAWVEHPQREIARVSNVDFDPSGRKPGVTCNLWAGWPTTPAKGSCDRLLEMLWHMCSGERKHSNDLFQWVCRWLAYPIQHPGAKLKSCIVVHGPQGTGKNLFFEAYMSIFGPYGRMLDQSALEDKFNDWASRKLFLLADEVVARTEVYHLKNKLKSLITGDRIRINPKNLAAYEEDNHANFVFLSNEAMPVVLEEDDRRHAVIWTPGKLGAEFYQALVEEIRNGGAAALHDYLLHFPLGDFHVGTPPPMTSAKADLIGLGLDSPLRWYDELTAGDIPGLKPRPAPSKDWYEAYKIWCTREGTRAAPCPRFVHALERKRGVVVARKRYDLGGADELGPHGFLLIGDIPGDESTSEAKRLGTSVRIFRAQLGEYRGQS